MGEGIAKFINFIAEVYFTLVEKVSGFLAKLVGSLVSWLKSNRDTLESAIDLFNNFAEGVGKALAAIPNFLAMLLEKFGTFFKEAADGVAKFIKKAADGLRLIPKIGDELAKPLDAAAEKISSFGSNVETTLAKAAKPLRNFASKITDATKQVIDNKEFDKVVSKIEKVETALKAVSTTQLPFSHR